MVWTAGAASDYAFSCKFTAILRVHEMASFSCKLIIIWKLLRINMSPETNLIRPRNKMIIILQNRERWRTRETGGPGDRHPSLCSFLAGRIPRLPFDSSVFICGTRTVLPEKLEVKMTKAFGKLQGFVFTILSMSMAFGPLAFSSEEAKKKKRKKGENTTANFKYRVKNKERP